MNKRALLETTAGCFAAIFTNTGVSLALTDQQNNSLKVGIITDLHLGNLAPDVFEQFSTFATDPAEVKPDYVFQHE